MGRSFDSGRLFGTKVHSSFGLWEGKRLKAGGVRLISAFLLSSLRAFLFIHLRLFIILARAIWLYLGRLVDETGSGAKFL